MDGVVIWSDEYRGFGLVSTTVGTRATVENGKITRVELGHEPEV